MGKVLPSKYGKDYYFPYKDEKGKNRGIPIKIWVYKEYYEPGYLTDDMIEEMLAGKNIEFDAVNKKGQKVKVKANLVPYINAYNTQTLIIVFDSDDAKTDNKIIQQNAEKIVQSFYNSSSAWIYDYTSVQKFVNSLQLTDSWKTYAKKTFYYEKKIDETTTKGIQCYTVDVYQVKNNKNKFVFYGKVEDGVASMLDEGAYKAEEKKADDWHAEQEAKHKAEQEAMHKLRVEFDNAVAAYKTWQQGIIDILEPALKDSHAFIAACESIVGSAAVDEAYFTEIINNKRFHNNCMYYVFKTHGYYDSQIYSEFITLKKHSDVEVNACKNEVLKRLAAYLEWKKLQIVRKDIYDLIQTEGIENVVAGIDIDVALDIGKFKEVKKILLKYKDNPVRAICFEMYKDVNDLHVLKDNIMNLLKIYHDFYDFPEKDRKALAKFIAVHRLDDYYDIVSQFDDVLEELIDNSKDPKLLKPLLGSIAGTARANVLKDKTFYFEKVAKLTDDIEQRLLKPVELLDRLRKLIPEYNAGSNSCIIANIELDAYNNFTFCFYTYSDDKNGADFDGRRIQYMTRVYNRSYPKEKIYFTYD